MATRKQVIDVMRSWVGRSEANGGHKSIIDIYNAKTPLPRGYKVKYTDEWCDTGISAAFIQAGGSDLIGRECGVEKHIQIFKELGIWNEDGTITPQPGDVICYNWESPTQPNNGGADHIGLVEDVVGNEITVIECNLNETVARRTIPVGWGYIRGYAKPNYQQDSNAVDYYAVAKDVIKGKYGNGVNRKNNLLALGFDYDQVQRCVNEILSGKTSSSKTQAEKNEAAKRVIRGQYGNGSTRKQKLESDGFDCNEIQTIVNSML